ncbi:peroxiredoxin [Tepiditoga spiralis]|uniref:Peroxiredoxin n=1 Tax=Tepiditoga spiralis TaxID=2108365 RepID=A0A7G1G6E9_9BACT|nr:peroxiredoxin [Tepiditoga spiralis]BBE30393.1 peroxiredoxin [Tepiditoga spiralis]
MIKVGEKAIDFNVKDHNGNEVKLSNYKGKKVLLSFHPLAFTGVCETQMKNLDIKYKELEKLNVIPLGFSVDSQFAKKAWADQMMLKNLQLVTDFWPHGEVAKNYGIFNEELGFSERANILIDENGIVEFVKVYPIKEQPNLNEILDYLKK